MTRSLFARSIALSVVSAAGITALLRIPGGSSPSEATPEGIIHWWEVTGTASASADVLRAAMICVLVYAGVVALFVAALSLRAAPAQLAIVTRLVSPTILRYLTGGALVAATMAPTVVAAQEPVSFDVVDLGPAIVEQQPGSEMRSPFVVVDLGPIAATNGALPIDSIPPDATADSTIDAWVVQRGDHLWSIAAETVSDEIDDPSDHQITVYWRKLINANGSALGADPDLIHPGQTISLPPL